MTNFFQKIFSLLYFVAALQCCSSILRSKRPKEKVYIYIYIIYIYRITFHPFSYLVLELQRCNGATLCTPLGAILRGIEETKGRAPEKSSGWAGRNDFLLTLFFERAPRKAAPKKNAIKGKKKWLENSLTAISISYLCSVVREVPRESSQSRIRRVARGLTNIRTSPHEGPCRLERVDNAL